MGPMVNLSICAAIWVSAGDWRLRQNPNQQSSAVKELSLESGKTSLMLSLAWPRTEERVMNWLSSRSISSSVEGRLMTNSSAGSMSSVLARSEGLLWSTLDEFVPDLVGPAGFVRRFSC